MVWSHLHPAVIHFAVGVGLLYFLWDLSQLTKKSSEALPGERFFGEVAGAGVLVVLEDEEAAGVEESARAEWTPTNSSPAVKRRAPAKRVRPRRNKGRSSRMESPWRVSVGGRGKRFRQSRHVNRHNNVSKKQESMITAECTVGRDFEKISSARRSFEGTALFRRSDLPLPAQEIPGRARRRTPPHIQEACQHLLLL